MNISPNIISHAATTKAALEQLNKVPKTLTLFITNDESVMLGTLTDGDIRRGFLKNLTLENPLSDFINTSFKFVTKGEYDNKAIKKYRKLGIKLLPILDNENRITKIINLENKNAILPLDAVIMAGGLGTRLRPLTENIPKPLLPVAGKPIVEYNIDRLDLFGVNNIYFSIKYLGEKIRDYFTDGAARSLDIGYVEEEKPLGTIGSILLIDQFENDYVLVMNSDILTNIDFEEMYLTLINSDADMIVATKPYEVNIPYGVVETVGQKILALVEKPTYTYYSNAGIYMMKKSVLQLIPKDTFFNATDLIQVLINLEKKVVNFPIKGYWLDIGKHADYEKAQSDVHQIVF